MVSELTKAQIRKWVKERDAVVKTYDIEKFKAFWIKWQKKGLYDKRMALPPDNVIEISLRKMVCATTSATDAEKEEAKQWLSQRGYSSEL